MTLTIALLFNAAYCFNTHYSNPNLNNMPHRSINLTKMQSLLFKEVKLHLAVACIVVIFCSMECLLHSISCKEKTVGKNQAEKAA
jgi:hypothetical protein